MCCDQLVYRYLIRQQPVKFYCNQVSLVHHLNCSTKSSITIIVRNSCVGFHHYDYDLNWPMTQYFWSYRMYTTVRLEYQFSLFSEVWSIWSNPKLSHMRPHDTLRKSVSSQITKPEIPLNYHAMLTSTLSSTSMRSSSDWSSQLSWASGSSRSKTPAIFGYSWGKLGSKFVVNFIKLRETRQLRRVMRVQRGIPWRHSLQLPVWEEKDERWQQLLATTASPAIILQN